MPFRVIVLANRSKPEVVEALEDLKPWLASRATIVADLDTRALSDESVASLPQADLAIALGGDGTMLGQARQLVKLDMPLLGVNFGKLGFLAEFSLDDLRRYWGRIVSRRTRVTHRLMVDVDVFAAGAPEWGLDNGRHPVCLTPKFQGIAMNDAVIAAGAPFRMIELELAIEPEVSQTSATQINCDGMIVATPTGSTAHNMSNGGPIVAPGVPALSITAISPQTLAFRPIVVSADCDLWMRAVRVNAGTTLVLDGQQLVSIRQGDQVRVRRHPRTLQLTHNPELTYWSMLARKMHWAARPRRT